MKKEIKDPESSVEYIIKTMETYVSVVKNIPRTKIQMLEKLNKIDLCSFQIVLFVARKNQLS